MVPSLRSPPSMRTRSCTHTLYALLVFYDFACSDTSHVAFTDSSAPRTRSSIFLSLPQNPRLLFGCSCSRLEALGGLGWSNCVELEFCCTALFSSFGEVCKNGLGAFFCLGERALLESDCSCRNAFGDLVCPSADLGERALLGFDCSRPNTLEDLVWPSSNLGDRTLFDGVCSRPNAF